MNSKHTTLGIIDGQEEDVLDKISRYIEIARLSRKISEKMKSDLEDLVIKIDNIIQDLEELHHGPSLEIVKRTLTLLKALSNILNEGNFSRQETIFLFHFLNEVYITLNSVNDIGISNFHKIIDVMFVELAFMPRVVIHENHITSLKKERLSIIEQNQREIEKLTWPLELDIILSDNNDSKSLQTLAIFIECLNSIEDVRVTIEEIKKGSLISRLKIYFQSPEAKKQATELLESTKKFAIGKLEKEYSESEKIKRETQKIEAETQLIIDAKSAENSEENIKRRALGIEALELENQRKRLENQKLELDIFAQKTLVLKQLLTDQLVSQEQFQILINKHLFISKSNEAIIVGESINEIENKS